MFLISTKQNETLISSKNCCQDKIISTGAHVDSGFLTLLETFGQPGLELELEGEWRSVLVSQNLLVVNIGEQLGKGTLII